MTYVGHSIYNDSNFIAHHGILGMKWGIRRYQNPDGSLTSAGIRRYRKLSKQQEKLQKKMDKVDKKSEKLSGEKEHTSGKSETNKSLATKSVFDMTDDEINKEIARMDLEKKYKEHLSEYQKAYATPEEKSVLRETGKYVVNDIIKPSFTNVSKQATEKAIGMAVNKLGNVLGLEKDLYYNKDWAKTSTQADRDKAYYNYQLEREKLKQSARDTRRANRTAVSATRRALRDAERERRRNRREARRSSGS